MRVLLINASHPSYNLGMKKAENWWRRQGAAVSVSESFPELMAGEFDVVWVSAIFSWHVPRLLEAARAALEAHLEVEVGGPGTFGVRPLVRKELGIDPQCKPDPRFENEPGEYAMVFWSRGCPAKNCSLGFPRDGQLPVCSVPEMEGWKYTLFHEVTPARVILDNNLSALPRAHQEFIVEKTAACCFKSVDANSGFEPRSIRPWVIDTWKRLPLVCWRFAYDELREHGAVLKTLAMLDDAGVKRNRCHIYCLAGNEPMSDCEFRVHQINEWGCYPIVQRRRPLDWVGGPLPTLFDWTEQGLIDFQRWGNRFGKGFSFDKYERSRKDRPMWPQLPLVD